MSKLNFVGKSCRAYGAKSSRKYRLDVKTTVVHSDQYDKDIICFNFYDGCWTKITETEYLTIAYDDDSKKFYFKEADCDTGFHLFHNIPRMIPDKDAVHMIKLYVDNFEGLNYKSLIGRQYHLIFDEEEKLYFIDTGIEGEK